MSLLWVALRLILGVNIRIDDARRWTRMIGSGLPGTLQQFHPAQFLKDDATPILRRPDRPQSALAISTLLIAEYARLAQPIPAQSVRAK